MEKKSDDKPRLEVDDTIAVGEVLNASGHKQELERQFSLLSICSVGITTGNVWAALGGSIVSSTRLGCPETSYLTCMMLMQSNRSLHYTMEVLLESSTSSSQYHVSTS